MAIRDLRILSYNVQMRPLKWDRLNKERAKLIPQFILSENPDVVVFQEAFDDAPRHEMRQRLQKAYPFSTGILDFPGILQTNGGVEILSRYPIRKKRKIEFKEEAGGDKWAAKGAWLAKIEAPEGSFWVLGTHLQSGREHADIRKSQLREIRRLVLRQHLPMEEPLFFAGDFNVAYQPQLPNSEFQQMLGSLAGRFAFQKTGLPHSSDPWYNNFHPDFKSNKNRRTLDYVLFGQDQLHPVGGKQHIQTFRTQLPWHRGLSGHYHDLSDHFPVIGNYRVNFPGRYDSQLFPGTWRRMKLNQRFREDGPRIFLKQDRTFEAEIQDGKMRGRFERLLLSNEPRRGKLFLWNATRGKRQEWNYEFHHNPSYQKYYFKRPLSDAPENPPHFNELLLYRPKYMQSYAFIASETKVKTPVHTTP